MSETSSYSPRNSGNSDIAPLPPAQPPCLSDNQGSTLTGWYFDLDRTPWIDSLEFR
jgi:hypothetical protein